MPKWAKKNFKAYISNGLNGKSYIGAAEWQASAQTAPDCLSHLNCIDFTDEEEEHTEMFIFPSRVISK